MELLRLFSRFFTCHSLALRKSSLDLSRPKAGFQRVSPLLDFLSVTKLTRKSQRADAKGRRSGGPRRVLSPGTLGDDAFHEIRTRHTTRFRSYGAQIESDVALGRRLK